MISGRNTGLIKQKALELGFSYVGIAKAERLEEDARRLEAWLNANYNGKMAYMANHFDKRVDPRLLVDGAKSVVTLMMNYFPEKELEFGAYKISKYAYGEDYHLVIREKLNTILAYIRSEIGEVAGRGFVDSAPVLERAWAVKSGLGWVGKNGNLISKKSGSFFFLATLILDIDLDYDMPMQTDHCGTCRRCIDVCPTEAILPNKEVNGSQCISYFTIELKEAFSDDTPKWKDWIFGCDICQDVCPWNRFSFPHREEKFSPSTELTSFDEQDLEQLTMETYHLLFQNSAIKRTKFDNFVRNREWLRLKK